MWEGEITKGHEEILGDMDVFTALNVVMVSQIYTYIKPTILYIFNMDVLIVSQESCYQKRKVRNH